MSQPLSPSANAEYHTLFNSKPPFRDDHRRLLSRWRLQFDWPSFSYSIGHSYSFCYRLIVNPVAYGAYPHQYDETFTAQHTGIPTPLHPKHSVQHYSSYNISPVICIESDGRNSALLVPSICQSQPLYSSITDDVWPFQ